MYVYMYVCLYISSVSRLDQISTLNVKQEDLTDRKINSLYSSTTCTADEHRSLLGSLGGGITGR